MSGRVLLVGAGPGAPDLVTLRGWRALRSADVVLYDALVDPELVRDLPARTIYVGKRCGRHSLPQGMIEALLVSLARQGLQVVRLKGGDPMVFGRGMEEARALAEAGIPFEIVPGVTSAVAAPEAAGIPVTFRGVADAFQVICAHRRDGAVDLSLPPWSERTTLVLLMGVATVQAWTAALLELGYPPDLEVAFVERAFGSEQRVLTTTLGAAAPVALDHGLRAPAVAVVGRVVALRDPVARWMAPASRELHMTRTG